MGVRYLRVRWLHEGEDEPVLLYSELDEGRMETRKVEEYRDGRLDLADATTRTGSTWLGDVALPSIEEINQQGEFDGREISRDEFEVVWRRAVDIASRRDEP